MAGVFIFKGMQFGVSGLQFTSNDDGSPHLNLQISLRYDACYAWAKIALSHAAKATQASLITLSAWKTDNELAKASALEAEFEYSLQAIVAAASSIDAFYSQVASQFPVDDATKAAWRKNRTSRPTQVCETLRIAFGLGPQNTSAVKNLLSATYKIRDAALHPSGSLQPPQFHEALDVNVEWRFWTFRAEVADSIVKNGLGLIWDLIHLSENKLVLETQFVKSLIESFDKLLPNGRPEPQEQTASFWLP